MKKYEKKKSRNLVLILLVLLFAITGTIYAVDFYTAAAKPEIEQPLTSPLRGENVVSVDLVSMQNTFNQVVEEVLPAVVEVDVTQTIVQDTPSFGGFPWFFNTPDSREYEQEGLGSGVIFRREGDTYFAITNHHVAGDADKIVVVLADEREYPADLVGTDKRRDIAVVKFETKDRDISLATLGTSGNLKVGDWVLAMGSPFGFYSSVTAGIVSALGRSGKNVNNINDFIQTDASINQGNSGGPLVNLYGEVIGINTWIAAPTGGNIGLGFAIPIDNAKDVVSEILEYGRVRDGWLGVSMLDPYEFDAFFEDLGLKDKDGVFVMNVYPNAPAWKSGIRPGDFIVKFDDSEVLDTEVLSRLISNANLDEEVTVTVLRQGEKKSFSLVLEERQSSEDIEKSIGSLWPGVFVQPLDDDMRESLKIGRKSSGILLAFTSGITAENPFYNSGLRNYDVITEINGRKMDSVSDFYEALNESGVHTYKISYIRNEQKMSVVVERQVL